MAAPEPRPTLLSSIGVSGGEAPTAPPRPDNDTEPEPRLAPPRKEPSHPSRSSARSASDGEQTAATPETLSDALDAVRRRHRDRRTSGVRMPLAPLNVDLPLELLDHLRQLSQDIPYPLRRLAEEAIELWLEATGNQPTRLDPEWPSHP